MRLSIAAASLVTLLPLAPGIAAGQAPIVPPSPAAPIVIDPRTPPPPTIPSGPEPVVPIPVPETGRPAKTFDIRPSIGVSEEYSDNFNQTPTNKVSNFRSAVIPGLLVLVDLGLLTGQAAYYPTVFYDSSLDKADVNNAFSGQLTWQALPRLKLSASEVFTQGDEPSQADRLSLRTGRQQFTSNLLSLTGDYVFDPYAVKGYYHLSTFSSGGELTATQTPGANASFTFLKSNRLTLGYEYLDSRTTSDIPRNDSTITGHQVAGTVSRDVTRDLTAGITAVYAVREEQKATGNTDLTRKSVSLFVNYVVPDLVIQGNIGVVQFEGGSLSGRPLLTTDSTISYYLGPAVLGLRLERGFSETFEQGQNFGIVETSSISASVAYKFTPLLSGLITGGYRENKQTGEGGGQAGRTDKVISAGAHITYQIFRWLSASLDYTYTDLTSSNSLNSYVENLARAGLNASV